MEEDEKTSEPIYCTIFFIFLIFLNVTRNITKTLDIFDNYKNRRYNTDRFDLFNTNHFDLFNSV